MPDPEFCQTLHWSDPLFVRLSCFVRSLFCQTLVLFHSGFVRFSFYQTQPLSDSCFVRPWLYQTLVLSHCGFVRLWFCQRLVLSDFDFVRLWFYPDDSGLFLMQCYFPPGSNAKSRQIFPKGRRKLHFLLIKSQNFEIVIK